MKQIRQELSAWLLFLAALIPGVTQAAPADVFTQGIFVKYRESIRKTVDLDDHENNTRSLYNSYGAAVTARFAGESLIDVVRLPDGTNEQRAFEFMAALRDRSAIERVAPDSFWNLEFRTSEFRYKFGPSDPIPNQMRRGYRMLDKQRYVDTLDLSASHRPGTLVVKLSEHEVRTNKASLLEGLAQLHRGIGATLMYEYAPEEGALYHVVMFDPAAQSMRDVARAYMASSSVEYACPDYLVDMVISDPNYSSQAHFPQISATSSGGVWGIRTDSSACRIGILDSGIDTGHSDLPTVTNAGRYRIVGGSLVSDSNILDDIFHGTVVAGIVGEKGNNGSYGTGLSWTSDLAVTKVLGPGGGSFTVVGAGIDSLRTNGAKVINASLGNPNYSLITPPLTPYTGTPTSDPLGDAIYRARSANIIIVAAAGNAGYDSFGTYYGPVSLDNAATILPAGYPYSNVVAVASTNYSDVISSFSNYGTGRVDFSAPGENFYTATPTYSTADMSANGIPTTFGNAGSGTSYAAPLVSSLLGLAYAEFPSERNIPTQLIDRLRMSVDYVSGLSSYTLTSGRINAAKALGDRSKVQNLSTRGLVQSGSGVMIAGFVVQGVTGGTRRVYMRVLGPSLTSFGVSGAISNPKIDLYGPSGLIASNDDYGTLSSSDLADLSSAGLTPFNSLDSALVQDLGPGSYTVVVSGVLGATGVALVEAYEPSSPASDRGLNRLINISTRLQVGTGANVAIAGFVVTGSNPRRVLIRGIGPSLTAFGISGALADPEIELFDASGNSLASNTSWGSIANYGALQRLQYSGYAPTDSSEAALVVTLPPALYSVHLRGQSAGTGIGLVEIYEF
ncbi:MAG: S8 family serine peptidase [Verrucomicrobia bacterium]|nr:S8 family serine peptidase [Verrucomicrobiota bacterium]